MAMSDLIAIHIDNILSVCRKKLRRGRPEPAAPVRGFNFNRFLLPEHKIEQRAFSL